MSQTTTRERSALDAFADKRASREASEGVPAVIEPHALAILSRSEMEAQMHGAEIRPRNLARFHQTVLDIATASPEAAAECFYSLPARSDDGEPIEGPSARFAELLLYAFGNATVSTRIIEEGQEFVTAQGTFTDLERNTATRSEVRRRIVGKTGRRYSADMRNVTANAAASIAKRNAILSGIPKPLWSPDYEETRAAAVPAAGNIEHSRARALAAFREIGATEQQVLKLLKLDAIEAIGLDDITRLRGIYTAVREGITTLKEVFADQAAAPDASRQLDQFAQQGSPGVIVPSTPPGDSDGADGRQPDGDGVTAAADVGSPSMEPASAVTSFGLRIEALDKLLRLATDKDLSEEERLEEIDLKYPLWSEKLADQPDFLTALFPTVTKLAKGELKLPAARKYLEGIK